MTRTFTGFEESRKHLQNPDETDMEFAQRMLVEYEKYVHDPQQDSQIDKLAKFIQENFDEEITEGGAIDVAMKSMTHWRNVAFDLWRLLDNIDTMDDMCKGDDAACRAMVNKEANRRHAILLLEGDLGRRYIEHLGKAYGEHLKEAYE